MTHSCQWPLPPAVPLPYLRPSSSPLALPTSLQQSLCLTYVPSAVPLPYLRPSSSLLVLPTSLQQSPSLTYVPPAVSLPYLRPSSTSRRYWQLSLLFEFSSSPSILPLYGLRTSRCVPPARRIALNGLFHIDPGTLSSIRNSFSRTCLAAFWKQMLCENEVNK